MTLRFGLPFVVTFGLEMDIFEEKSEDLKGKSTVDRSGKTNKNQRSDFAKI
jgi:hypothetical protein